MKYDLQTVNAGVNTLKQGISLASSAISLVKNASSNKEERKFNKSVTQLEHDTALRMMKHDSNVLFTKKYMEEIIYLGFAVEECRDNSIIYEGVKAIYDARVDSLSEHVRKMKEQP